MPRWSSTSRSLAAFHAPRNRKSGRIMEGYSESENASLPLTKNGNFASTALSPPLTASTFLAARLSSCRSVKGRRGRVVCVTEGEEEGRGREGALLIGRESSTESSTRSLALQAQHASHTRQGHSPNPTRTCMAWRKVATSPLLPSTESSSYTTTSSVRRCRNRAGSTSLSTSTSAAWAREQCGGRRGGVDRKVRSG